MASTINNSQTDDRKTAHPRGSGNDANSDTRRLYDEENLQDKTNEDSFPASDPPSNTPVSGVGRTNREVPVGTKADFKENGAEQFEYGRRTAAKTLHVDPSTNRLRKGNPDVGNIDLGNIEADKKAQPDDNDHYD